MQTGALGAVREIVGGDTDALPCSDSRREAQGVPLRLDRRQHIDRVDLRSQEDSRMFIHHGNTEVAPGIHDDLSRLGHANRWCEVNARAHEVAVSLGHDAGRLRIAARDCLRGRLVTAGLVAGIDGLGRVVDDAAGPQHGTDSARGRDHGRQVRAAGIVDGRVNGNDEESPIRQVLGAAGERDARTLNPALLPLAGAAAACGECGNQPHVDVGADDIDASSRETDCDR